MINSNPEYQPTHKSQFEIINRYRSQIENLSNQSLEIKPITKVEDGSVVSRGFRILLSKNEQAKNGLITDWDDTLENYSSRKTKYFSKLYKLLNEEIFGPENSFASICNSVNKAARILNWQKIHPENYSPFLEMVVETQLIFDANHNSENKYFLELIKNPSETTARQYILHCILPKFGDNLRAEENNNKLYFVEGSHQSLAHSLEENHDLISIDVNNLFNEAMTEPNLSQEDMSVFDLDESTYWAISTFGLLEFQLKKILGALELLKTAGARMPNEIMIITHGRKKEALLDIMNEKPDINWTYVDDSERQLVAMDDENNTANLVNAKRPGAKRFDEQSKYQTTNMRAPLSSLLT